MNAIVGQSGGPTSAINATLAGVISGMYEKISGTNNKIYGMRNGIEGLLDEKIIDISNYIKNAADLELLAATPASALGSCRYRLQKESEKPEIYAKIFEIFGKYDIRYFFYIGGNDSMDTVKKLSDYAAKISYPISIVGVPKTIDNDLEGTDHSPGFGSAAKYIASTMTEICADNAVYTQKSVVITEIMGRDAGWLTMSAMLPRKYGLSAPDFAYLPECVFDLDKFVESVKNALEKKSNIVIAVSEGIRDAGGNYICNMHEKHSTDNFGHTWLSGTANALKTVITERIGCKVRAIELNTPQRCAGHLSSKTDLVESIAIGEKATDFAAEGKSGIMAVFKRTCNVPYTIKIAYEDISSIANQIKIVPECYINGTRDNITDEGLDYVAPLVLGEPDIKRLGGMPVHFKF